jgi:hypothetical protein
VLSAQKQLNLLLLALLLLTAQSLFSFYLTKPPNFRL